MAVAESFKTAAWWNLEDSMRVVEITPADPIQANLNSIDREGGGKLVLTPGDYFETGTISIPKAVEIEGIGNYCSADLSAAPVIIRHVPTVACDLFTTDYDRGKEAYRRIAPISGITCVAGALSKAAFRLESCSTFLISRCAAVNFPVGFVIQASICSILDQCYAEGTYQPESYPVLFIAGPHPTTTMAMRDCRLRRGEWGLLARSNALHSLSVESPTVESCVEGGMRFDGGGSVRIANPYWEEVGKQVLRHAETTRVTLD